MIIELNKAFKLIDNKDKTKLYILILFYYLTIFLELFSLAMVLPVVNIFFSESNILENTFVSNYFDVSSIEKYKFHILLLFLFAFVLKNIAIILITKLKYNYLFYIQSKVAKNLYSSYIVKTYKFFLKNSISTLSNIVVSQSQSIKAIIEVFIIFIVEGSLALFVLIFLLLFNTKITLFLILLFLLIYFFFYPFLKKVTTEMGNQRILFGKLILKVVNESFGGIKTVKIYKKEDFFKNLFFDVSDKTWNVEKKNIFLLEVPRYFIEIILISIFVFLITYFSYNDYSNDYIISFCALFLVALYRLMPSFNRILAAVHNLRYFVPTINIISKEINNLRKQEKEFLEDNFLEKGNNIVIQNNIKFENDIILKNIYFKYDDDLDYIFKDLNLKISRNKFIGIIGPSGSGKTTLIDIFSGLLKVNSGKIFIDKTDITNKFFLLKNRIGYVPQDIFLIEDTILSNIVFNDLNDKDYKINQKKLNEAIDNSNLREFINSCPKKLNTLIGENGVQLSGGQRQRIGIARAIYRNSEIIIFDEATSALDKETENKILDEIKKLKQFKTIIYITHKENTLKFADEIYKIEKNKLILVN